METGVSLLIIFFLKAITTSQAVQNRTPWVQAQSNKQELNDHLQLLEMKCIKKERIWEAKRLLWQNSKPKACKTVGCP